MPSRAAMSSDVTRTKPRLEEQAARPRRRSWLGPLPLYPRRGASSAAILWKLS
ncbi:MAG: hypothetical protein MZV64_22865 [Ignavibacteriales bacterium]|nr:hypothetical protein [Ignavibacteriales bacterium]